VGGEKTFPTCVTSRPPNRLNRREGRRGGGEVSARHVGEGGCCLSEKERGHQAARQAGVGRGRWRGDRRR